VLTFVDCLSAHPSLYVCLLTVHFYSFVDVRLPFNHHVAFRLDRLLSQSQPSQITSYAKRKGTEVESVEKWLGPILAYDN
jgi:hypothetical protein